MGGGYLRILTDWFIWSSWFISSSVVVNMICSTFIASGMSAPLCDWGKPHQLQDYFLFLLFHMSPNVEKRSFSVLLLSDVNHVQV